MRFLHILRIFAPSFLKTECFFDMKKIILGSLSDTIQQFSDIPQVATIGMFDGVHLGHQYLLRQLSEEAQRSGMESMVVTFDRHPLQVLRPDYQPRLLTATDTKLSLLSGSGVENCAILPFNSHTAGITARVFMEEVLYRTLNIRKLIIGHDNHFGKRSPEIRPRQSSDKTSSMDSSHRQQSTPETFEDYVSYGKQIGIEVIQAKPFLLNLDGKDTAICSSLVRTYIERGDMKTARQCLGHPYTITGLVVKGFQEGRRMGYPTANLNVLPKEQLIPAPGVYAVRVRLPGTIAEKVGMMNIGMRPTFNGHELTLETHIIDFREDIYGQQIQITFGQRIRNEYKFDSPEQLAEQLDKDKEIIKNLYNQEQEDE